MFGITGVTPGYPQIGASWSIVVYKVTPDVVSEYAENATVKIGVLTETKAVEWYSLSTDEKGSTSFQYLYNQSEVCFQAFLTGYEPSGKIVLNTSYVSESTGVQLTSFSLVCLGLALGGGKYLGKRRKSIFGKILHGVLLFIMLISSLILIFTFYSFLFNGTVWGFPSEVIAPYVAFET